MVRQLPAIEIAVVIPTKNEERNLARLLESLLSDSFEPQDIVVVDNQSIDHTSVIARNFGVNLLTYGPNQSAQRNCGFRSIIAQYYLFLDADMEIESGLRSELLNLASDGIECAIIPEVSIASNFLSHGKAFDRYLTLGDHTSESARFFSRRVFTASGLYDESITGGEDWLVSSRAGRITTIATTSKTIMHHEGELTVAGLMRKYIKYGRGYSRLCRLSARDFAVHVNPLRFSLLLRCAEFFRRPWLATGWLIYKTLTYTAGFIGFVLEGSRALFSREKSSE